MKKSLAILLLLAMGVSLVACGGASDGNLIPDVFGINYESATKILEADGYEVNAIETSVGEISEKLLYPLEKVSKGNVFKIDGYILDNLGHLTKDYDVFYEGELVSEDKSVVIYYAKEDYALEKEVSKSNEANKDTASDEKIETVVPEKEPSKSDEGIRTDFKAAMDSYEKFIDEYVAFMKKYKNNSSDLSIITEYSDYMSRYTEMVADFDKWEDAELNDAEMAYYIEVQARVSKKIIEVAQ